MLPDRQVSTRCVYLCVCVYFRSDVVYSHVCKTRSYVCSSQNHDSVCVCVFWRGAKVDSDEGANKNGYFACRSDMLFPLSSLSPGSSVRLCWDSAVSQAEATGSPSAPTALVAELRQKDQLSRQHPCEPRSNGTPLFLHLCQGTWKPVYFLFFFAGEERI